MVANEASIVFLAQLTNSRTCDVNAVVNMQAVAEVLAADLVIRLAHTNESDFHNLTVPNVKYGKYVKLCTSVLCILTNLILLEKLSFFVIL